jgi:hypothetical protein
MLWDYTTNELVGLHYFHAAVTAVACNPDDVLIAVGFETGAVGILDARVPAQLRLIFLERLHERPVRGVRFSANGQMLVSCGDDGRVFFVRVRDLTVIGYRAAPFASVLAFDVFPCAGVDRVLLASPHGQMHCLLLPPLGASPALGYAIDDDACKPHTCDIQVRVCVRALWVGRMEGRLNSSSQANMFTSFI